MGARKVAHLRSPSSGSLSCKRPRRCYRPIRSKSLDKSRLRPTTYGDTIDNADIEALMAHNKMTHFDVSRAIGNLTSLLLCSAGTNPDQGLLFARDCSGTESSMTDPSMPMHSLSISQRKIQRAKSRILTQCANSRKRP